MSEASRRKQQISLAYEASARKTREYFWELAQHISPEEAMQIGILIGILIEKQEHGKPTSALSS